jgi:hypothetical protein
MPETATLKDGANELLKNPIAVIQARFTALEQEARGRIVRAIGAGNEALHGLDEKLARVSRDDWTTSAMRKRLDGLRSRAETLRSSALKRVAEMPGDAVSAIAGGSRVRVQNLAKGLERIAKKLELPPTQPPSAA